MRELVRAQETARNQYGHLTRDQAIRVGVGERQLEHWIETAVLLTAQPTTYRFAAVPPSPQGDVMAAVLSAGPDALASHRSGAVLRRLPIRAIERPEITVLGASRHRLENVLIHRTDRLDLEDRDAFENIPTSSIFRLLLDLGWLMSYDDAECIYEDAIFRGYTSQEALEEVVRRLGKRGRRGTANLRRYLKYRDPAARPAESVLEVKGGQLIRQHGLPPGVTQHWVKAKGIWVRIDRAYVPEKVGIEWNGFRFHRDHAALERHDEKISSLTAAGWNMLEFTWMHVTQRPAWVAGCIRDALRKAA
ncbi:MAG: hypothetical protein QOG87_1 [Actinomycetota bacterium]|jgi:hypothetical protein